MGKSPNLLLLGRDIKIKVPSLDCVCTKAEEGESKLDADVRLQDEKQKFKHKSYVDKRHRAKHSKA